MFGKFNPKEKILIKAVRIVDKNSSHNNKVRDVLLHDGKIIRIAAKGLSGDRTISGKGLCISPGWTDLRGRTGEPGYEYKEDLDSFCKSAAAGGFTETAVLPDTDPVIRSKDLVVFLKNAAGDYPLCIHPVAAVSRDENGVDPTDMIDLYRAGAVAFSDGSDAVADTGLMLRSLQYLQAFGGLLINRPDDRGVSFGGLMNEGAAAVLSGVKGIPALAEELMINRDLSLLEYTGGRLHFSCISTAGGVSLIKKAKAGGLSVTCDIAAHQLFFEDKDLEEFDTNLKVNPPFRTAKDIRALWKGLEDGTIDAVVSDHRPQDEESKKTEFDAAEFGIIGLQTAFAAVNTTNQGKLNLDLLIDKFTAGPRRVLGLKTSVIEEGESCNLTLFSDTLKYTFEEKDIRSKSCNSPFIGKPLVGKPLGVIFENRFYRDKAISS